MVNSEIVPSYDTPQSVAPSGYLVPMQSKLVMGFDPGVPDGYAVATYVEGDKITIRNGVFGFDPAFKNGAPVYMIDGKIVALDSEYHERTYQAYLTWLFDESHIVRGYD